MQEKNHTDDNDDDIIDDEEKNTNIWRYEEKKNIILRTKLND